MKRFAIIIALLMISVFSFAQQDVINAFKVSYEAENDKNYKKAAKAILEVYSADSYEMNLRLGWLYYSDADFESSVSYYKKAIALMPYAVEPKMGLVYPLYAQGNTDELIKTYQEILKINPMYYSALYYLGYIYYNQGKYVEALPMFKKLVDLYPFNHDALLMYAWTNYQLKKYKEAKILFNKVLMYNPSDESAQKGLDLIK